MACDPIVHAWSWRAIKGLNTEERLKKLKVPALAIAGTNDQSSGPAEVEAVLRQHPAVADAAVIAAEKAGKTPQQFVADIAAGRKPYLDGFHISFDHWSCTDSPENHQLAQDIYRALQAGATTYLLKDALSDELVSVIRKVHDGGRPLTPEVEAGLESRRQHPPLTPREEQVVQLISEGLRNKEIASELHISEETVQVHVKSILTKLSVNDRTAAVNVAVRRGIIHIVP